MVHRLAAAPLAATFLFDDNGGVFDFAPLELHCCCLLGVVQLSGRCSSPPMTSLRSATARRRRGVDAPPPTAPAEEVEVEAKLIEMELLPVSSFLPSFRWALDLDL